MTGEAKVGGQKESDGRTAGMRTKAGGNRCGMMRKDTGKRWPGAKGKGLGGLEDTPCLAGVAEQTDLQWLAMGLLGDVTGIFLQSLDAHHHGFCLCEAAHQAGEETRQRQGVRQHQAHQPCGAETSC